MKKNFRIFALASALMFGLAACSVEGPGVAAPENDKTPQMSEDVVSGELLVRFDPRVSEILERAGVTKSGINAPATRSGVLSVDEVLALVAHHTATGRTYHDVLLGYRVGEDAVVPPAYLVKGAYSVLHSPSSLRGSLLFLRLGRKTRKQCDRAQH